MSPEWFSGDTHLVQKYYNVLLHVRTFGRSRFHLLAQRIPAILRKKSGEAISGGSDGCCLAYETRRVVASLGGTGLLTRSLFSVTAFDILFLLLSSSSCVMIPAQEQDNGM